jgi:hypothetical protein
MTDKLDSKLLLALAIVTLTVIIVAISHQPAIGKADSIVPMNHWHAEASAQTAKLTSPAAITNSM